MYYGNAGTAYTHTNCRGMVCHAPTVDIIAMYKQAFFDGYGLLLTAVVEGRIAGAQIITPCTDENFKAVMDLTTTEVVKLRSRFFDGQDTEGTWLNALMKLIAAANQAAGNIALAHIALRASSLVVDGAKIMRKMKIGQECRGMACHAPTGEETI